MSLATAYRLMLLLPLVVPLPVLALLWVAGDHPLVNRVFGDIGLLLAMSPVVAGVPYGLFALLLWQWSLGRPAATVRRAMQAAPLLFVPVLLLVWAGYIVVTHGPEDRPLEAASILRSASSLVAAALGLGYAYVVIGAAVVTGFRRLQLVDDAAEQARAAGQTLQV